MSIVPQPDNNNCSWFNDRLYSSFGVTNRIHCVPVDEVRCCLRHRREA
jgi:hypothetical protein